MKKILSFVGASLVLAGAMFVTSCQDPKEYELSDIKTDTIQGLATPSNLAVTQSYGSVVLTWDVVANAAGYSVVRFDTSDSTDKKGTVVNASGIGNSRASSTTTVSDGNKGTVYIIDSSKELENGKKYRYEVSALATTTQNYDTSVARTLYFKDGGVASKTITAELPDTVDVASAVASGVSFAFNGGNNAVITLPTVAGLEYRYFLVGDTFNPSTSVTRTKDSNAGRAFTSPVRYVPIDTSVLKSTVTVTSNKANYDSDNYVNETVVANEDYQLFLAVRAKNTNKYGANWTIVNTGLVAETYSFTNTTGLTFRYHNINTSGASKFMFVVRDQLATNDVPSNYTYTIKGYKLDTDDNMKIIIPTTPTVNATVTLTPIDATNSTASGVIYGTEWQSDTIANGDTYLFVLERTRTSDKQISQKTTVVTGSDPTATTTFEKSLVFFWNTTSAWNLDTAGTNYTSDVNFRYNIGSNYTIGKVYKAKNNGYTTAPTTNNGLSSAFEEVTVTTNKTTDTDTTHEYGTKSYTTSVTKAAYDAATSTTGTQNYYYVLLVTEKSTNKTLVLSTIGYEYKLN